MFEVWESASEPGLYLVFRESPSFPGAFAVQDWIELGVGRVTDDIVILVDRDGQATFRAAAPFERNILLGPALSDDTI